MKCVSRYYLSHAMKNDHKLETYYAQKHKAEVKIKIGIEELELGLSIQTYLPTQLTKLICPGT